MIASALSMEELALPTTTPSTGVELHDNITMVVEAAVNSIQSHDQEEPQQKRLKVDSMPLVNILNNESTEPNISNEDEKGDENADLDIQPAAKMVIERIALSNAEAMAKLKANRLAFINQLKVNDHLDTKCYKYRRWYGAKVLAITPKGILIHFHGFKKNMKTLYRHDDFMHLAPEGSYVQPYPKNGNRSIVQQSEIDADLDTSDIAYTPPPYLSKQLSKPRIKTETPVQSECPTPQPNSSVQPSILPFLKSEAVSLPKQSRQKLQKSVSPIESHSIQYEDFSRWAASTTVIKPIGGHIGDLNCEQEICLACQEVEDDDMSEYILCDGGCLGSFHQSCVGITDPSQLGDTWLCEDCTRKEHACFICEGYGVVGDTVMKCSMGDCGKYYHPKCVLSDPRSHVKPNDYTVRCPRHVCNTCFDVKGTEGLMKCLYCPTSYHPKCVAPSARYNNSALICGRHRGRKLPSIPDFYGSHAICIDGSFRFPSLYLPPSAPSMNELEHSSHFRLPMYFIDESNSKPPRYTKLRRNLYLFKPKKIDLDDLPSCQCTGDKCDDECTNRVSFVECIGDLNSVDKKESRHFNCRLGLNCGNRALQEMKLPKTLVFKTSNGRGFGLKVLEPVKQGSLVIEYIGEVLNHDMKIQRLDEHAEKHPNDPNYYIMQLDKNQYLDGRFKGSESRFINHSCDPNCHLLKWEVGEYKRIAITALRDIQAEEELSYDYQMETNSTDSFKCNCGALKCRGTMAPQNLNWEAHEKMKEAEDAAKKTEKKGKKKRKRNITCKNQTQLNTSDENELKSTQLMDKTIPDHEMDVIPVSMEGNGETTSEDDIATTTDSSTPPQEKSTAEFPQPTLAMETTDTKEEPVDECIRSPATSDDALDSNVAVVVEKLVDACVIQCEQGLNDIVS